MLPQWWICLPEDAVEERGGGGARRPRRSAGNGCHVFGNPIDCIRLASHTHARGGHSLRDNPAPSKFSKQVHAVGGREDIKTIEERKENKSLQSESEGHVAGANGARRLRGLGGPTSRNRHGCVTSGRHAALSRRRSSHHDG